MKLLLTLAAGAVVIHLLCTEQGRSAVNKFKKSAEDIVDDLVEKGKSLFGDVKDKAGSVL